MLSTFTNDRALKNASATFTEPVSVSCQPTGHSDEVKKTTVMNEAILETQDASTQANNPIAVTESSSSEQRPGFCRHMPPGMTATMLWKAHGERIIKATRANFAGPGINVTDESYPPWLEGLFSLMHTRFLRLGYKHPPLPSAMKQVLEIVDAAMQKKQEAGPLNVAVVGGSVTFGRGSCVDPFKKQAVKSNQGSCQWPYQLQKLCDEFLGKNVVRVVNLAVGGTGTGLSTAIVKYKLYHDKHKILKKLGPDVIINAYSTNDSLPPGKNHTYDSSYQHTHRETAQKFIRACQESRPCSDLPLVVYLDDYVGNQHNLILGENSNGWLTQEMSDWYGSMFISYASVVRRLVYANQQETLLSAYWKWPKVEPHFPLSAHMSLSWVAAFAILSAAVDFCDDDYNDEALSRLFPEMFPQVIFDMVERVPPPKLNANTLIETVSDVWLEDTKADLANKARVCDQNETSVNPCAIGFIAGPMGTVTGPPGLAMFLRYFTVNASGWQPDVSIQDGGWSNKLGYVATEANASTTFYRDSTPLEVRTLKVYYLKSYGEKWKDSRARFTFRGLQGEKTILEKTFTLEGFHDSNTSIAYQYQLDLGLNETLPAKGRVELAIQLISGTSFKIVGLVICNQP